MAITPLPDAPETTDTPQQFNTKAFAWVQSLDTFVTEANAQAAEVDANTILSEEWASKTTGNVDSTDYSAKAWAIGGTEVTDTAGRGAAKEWAIETSSTVDGTEYSSKEYAIGTQIRGSVGSSKDWAIYTAATVDGTNYSAKYWADAASTSASAAASSAAAAQASANVTEWSGAASYSAGDNVYSPIDFFTYRNKTGSNATDPSGDSTNWELISGNVITTATQTLTNKTLEQPLLTGSLETKVATTGIGSPLTQDIDLELGNWFTHDLNSNSPPLDTTFSVSNVPASGTTASFILEVTNGGSATVTWFSGVEWPGGTAPTLSAAGRDVLGFYTFDGGTTWSGFILGLDVKASA